MNYHPEGIYVWDSWYFHHEGLSHCIHLQQIRPGRTPPGVLENEFAMERGALGHATSTDLIHWETQPTALYRGASGGYDDYDLWTGSVIRSGDTFYLYYTARTSREKGAVNRIALATSKDAIHWERHPLNPIISPDSRWYHGEANPRRFARSLWPTVDCRDMCVVKDPGGNGFWGYYAARQPAGEIASTAVIALVHSDNLVHWTHHPPCFAPGKYSCIEVPDVFFLDGKWYMLCLTGNGYGQRNRASEPNLGGPVTIYAVADAPQGPFRELDRNVLIGSEGWQGYSGKTLGVDDKRYLFYTQGEKANGSTFGSISLPKLLKADRQGRLLATYMDGLEKYATEDLLSPARRRAMPNSGQWGSLGAWEERGETISGACGSDWSLHVFDCRTSDVIVSADITLEDGRSAGLAFRIQGGDFHAGSYVVLLDVGAQEVVFTKLVEFLRVEGRRWELRPGRAYHLRVVALGQFFNIYVDDILCLQLHQPDILRGHIGLFVEQGRASFKRIKALEVMRPMRRNGTVVDQ